MTSAAPAVSTTLLVLSANRRFLLAVMVFCPEQLVDIPEATTAIVGLNLGDSCRSGEKACRCFREVEEVGGGRLLF